jgi:excisionase family DNA binding protein
MSGENTNVTDQRRAFRIKDFCALCSVSRSSAYKLMGEGKLRTVRVGGRRLIPKRQRPSPFERERKCRRPPRKKAPSLKGGPPCR